MGIFDWLKGTDIDAGVAECASTPNAVLLDVRGTAEYVTGRIPHSVNIPLDELGRVKTVAADLATPLYVYCLSGGRSQAAVAQLRGMGYSRVKNLGGISRYQGKVER